MSPLLFPLLGAPPSSYHGCRLQVDVAKPGDRVEITGIYRASSVRVNPRHRTVRALYKTYVDIVHIHKLERGRRVQQEEGAAAEEGGDGYQAHSVA